MKPLQTLGFLLVVLALLGTLGALIPAEGVRIGNGYMLRMPSPRQVLFPDTQEKVNIADILALPTDEEDASLTLAPDTFAVDILGLDTLPDAAAGQLRFDPSKVPPLEDRIVLHYPEIGKAALHHFFNALGKANGGKRPMRIMHYGDSQLEGDRITSYLRNKLQVQFGGQGPGLVPVADIVPHFSVSRSISANWKRYSAMGRRDSTQHHDRFGALSAFSRFTPILPDSAALPTEATTAVITLRPEKRSYARARDWTVCKLHYGWHRAPITLTLERNGELVRTETIGPADRLHIAEWRFPGTSEEITISLTGVDSPDVFGVSLEGPSGVAVDNIAARGGAGYEFRKMDQALLKAMYDALDVKLLILQYGGNTLPNIKNLEEVEQYGRFFGAQIARFQKMIPGVAVIVIGPSDMSIKEGDLYVTRPFLEEVRDAMKRNTLEKGGVFWDMYAAMGGRGSMVSWVEADPPLAAPDYTHFSPAGSKKIGELFYTALINDYATYHATTKTSQPVEKAPAKKKVEVPDPKGTIK